MNMMLETNQLTKHYGRVKAVQGLDLRIPEGSVFGILGPNGSGKSTTLGMVLGVVGATSGEYSWFGKGADHSLRREIGAILERPIFYPSFTAVQNLAVTARIKGVGRERIDACLKLVGLYERRDSKFKTYSLGMKQRLAIAAAMLPDPKVLILDEPTNGLDPEGIAEIRELIRAIAARGKTIVLASHLLDEVQKVCTAFCVLRSGRLIYQGEVGAGGDLSGGTASETLVDVESSAPELKDALTTIPFVNGVTPGDEGLITVALGDGKQSKDLNKALFEKGIVASSLIPRRQSLEEKFLEILRNDQ